ncbi:MAG: radical SAM/SPASM domain protein, ACGX system [Patescibacteria group bacterium]|jgi:radical SAM/SPASM domain protein of ACGX system
MNRSFGLQWHLTNECDQRCRHCYIWQKYEKEGLRKTPSLVQAKRIINDFIGFCDEMDVFPTFSITGGDPLLYSGVWEVLAAIKERGFGFTILGNPFHLTSENLSRLKDLGCANYQMSLDGLIKTHDQMRKPGSFDATVKALPLLHQYGIRSMIMSTVSLLNYQEIANVAELCVENGVGNFAFARYCPTRGDTQYNMSPVLYRQFLAQMWKVYDRLIEGGTKFSLKDHLWKAYLYEEGLFKLSEEKGLIIDGCHCGISHMTLLPNGTVYACRRFESQVGDISNQSFKEIFLSPKMDNYRCVERLDGCRGCELFQYCRGCHAVAAGTSGSFFDKDPQCWRCQ